MAKGGARPGAGRKKGQPGTHTYEVELYRKALIDAVMAKKNELAQALVNKGLSGDVPALKEINERALGKVKDSLDITSKGKQITGINYIVPQNGNNPKANTAAAPSEPGPQ